MARGWGTSTTTMLSKHEVIDMAKEFGIETNDLAAQLGDEMEKETDKNASEDLASETKDVLVDASKTKSEIYKLKQAFSFSKEAFSKEDTEFKPPRRGKKGGKMLQKYIDIWISSV